MRECSNKHALERLLHAELVCRPADPDDPFYARVLGGRQQMPEFCVPHGAVLNVYAHPVEPGVAECFGRGGGA
jgi:hypothetical protein